MIRLADAALLTTVGLAMGSFLGLVSLRLPEGRGVVSGRSACLHCHRTLSLPDLVPVFSWLALRGRCRSCGGRIPRRYPAMEAASAAIGLVAALTAAGPAAWMSAGFGWALLLIAVIDLEHFWLPRGLTLPLLAAGLAQAGWLAPQALPDRLIGAGLGWGLLAFIAVIYRRARRREGLGGGDPLMLAALGAWVGWQGLAMVMLIASLAGLAVSRLRGPLTAEARLPLGTFMALGAWVVWVGGGIATR